MKSSIKSCIICNDYCVSYPPLALFVRANYVNTTQGPLFEHKSGKPREIDFIYCRTFRGEKVKKSSWQWGFICWNMCIFHWGLEDGSDFRTTSWDWSAPRRENAISLAPPTAKNLPSIHYFWSDLLSPLESALVLSCLPPIQSHVTSYRIG